MRVTTERRGWGWAVLLPPLLAGFVLRAVFVWHHSRFAGDTLIYGDMAHNLLRHGVYGVTEDHIRPTLMRLPGYPLFLAACFAIFGDGRYVPVLWVQVLVDLATCWMLAELARRLLGMRVARWTLWLAALCPFTASYAATPLTETLSLACVAGALLGLCGWLQTRRMTWVVLTGLSLGAAVLLRPDQGLLGAAVLTVMAWCGWRRQLGLGAVVLAAAIMAMPLLPWAVRNWRVFHVVQPLSPKYANDPGEPAPLGFARWYRTWGVEFLSTMNVYWAWDGSPLSMGDLPDRAFDSPAERAQTAALIDRYNAASASTPALEAQFDALARQRIRAKPLQYHVLMPAARLADMWLRPRTEVFVLPVDWWRWRLHVRGSVIAAAYGLLNAALLFCAMAGWWRWKHLGWGSEPAVAAAVLLFCLLRCSLLLTIDNAEPRYTLECFPVVLLCAAIGLAKSNRSAKRA